MTGGITVGAAVIFGQPVVGDTHIGVAELRPQSRYNQDAAFFQTNYTVSTDILQVIAKGPPNACLDYPTS